MKVTGVLSAVVSLYLLNGCAQTVAFFEKRQHEQNDTHRYEAPTPEKKERFKHDLAEVAKLVKSQPNYHPIGLGSPEEKAWFSTLTYRLWDRQITRHEFITEATQRYPQKTYEFTLIADAFQHI